MNEIAALPTGWEYRKLGDVCEIRSGKNQKNVINPNGKFPIYGSSGIFGYADDFISDEYTTIIGRKGTINNPIYVKEKFWNVDTAFGLHSKKELDSKFLFYFCKSFNFHKLDKSTTIPSLSKADLLAIDIPVAPFNIQQTIVSKIEELFSELDKGIEDLKTAQAQLKVYRQSVLKWAFEGKSTNENVKDGELPEGWKEMKLLDLGTWKGGGTPSKQNKSFWEKGKNLWVSAKDMKCKIITDSIDKITDEAIERSSAKRISKGAILFVMRSGILRHTFPVAIAGKNLTVNQDLQSVDPFEFISSDYLYWYVVCKNQDIRRECSKDGTTVESIDSKKLKDFKIPLASIELQNCIVQEIESRLSVADKLEESIKESLEKAEALRQSILKKAFRGELI